MKSADFEIIDSHTEGEPTRVVVSGGPDLGGGPLAERARRFREKHSWLCGALCDEPRGHEAMVGAILCEPHEPDCAAGVIFFNNVSTLNMCIHGAIGVVVSLASMGRIGLGTHRLDTPVGVVAATLDTGGRVTVANVPSYRFAAAVPVEVPGWGLVHGDIAWGGNWFFLVENGGPEVCRANLPVLRDFALAVRAALVRDGMAGEGGMEIDHIELCGPPADSALADSRNYVLCPGGVHDRSPCGTGTSARLACLHAAGRLAPGAVWRQAGILDTVFSGTIEPLPGGRVLPRVSGRAWITSRAVCHFDPHDPFRHGIPAIHT